MASSRLALVKGLFDIKFLKNSLFGGDDRTRTYYLHSANVTLSQVSYTPNVTVVCFFVSKV